MQRSLPENTTLTTETHTADGIRTRNPRNRAASELRLRSLGQRDRQNTRSVSNVKQRTIPFIFVPIHYTVISLPSDASTADSVVKLGINANVKLHNYENLITYKIYLVRLKYCKLLQP